MDVLYVQARTGGYSVRVIEGVLRKRRNEIE